jgi:hypothetical protein
MMGALADISADTLEILAILRGPARRSGRGRLLQAKR